MKVLLIAHEKNMGGASKSLVTLAKELVGKGVEVHVVIPFSGGGVEKALINENIPYKHIFFGWWMEPSYWNALLKMSFRALHSLESLAVNRICSYAKKNGIQIIHSNSSAIDVGAKAALKLGIPHVWHIREFGDLDYRLDFMNAQRGDKSRAIEYMLSVPGKIVFISKALEEYYLKSLLGVRKQETDRLKEQRDNQGDAYSDNFEYRAAIDEITRRFGEASRVIYNGISKDYLINKSKEGHLEGGKRDTQIAPPKVVFLIAANLQRSKRQNLAIEAVKILKQEGYSDFKLIIAGGTANTADSREYEAELREQAKG
ncbi:MAG: glycosyltransferase family 4 protein, partial [Lachnospiraceae bacterium]|nr:glycosyltransferase family 4 protein [Candidatus Merdinaster equi]